MRGIIIRSGIDIIRQIVIMRAIGIYIRIKYSVIAGIRIGFQCIFYSDWIIFIECIVHTCDIGKCLLIRFCELIIVLMPKRINMHILSKPTFVKPFTFSIIHGAEHIQFITPVIPVQLFHETGILPLIITGTHIKSKSFPFYGAGSNLHHCFHRRIISCTGAGNQFYILNIFWLQLVQFRQITQQSSIHIDYRAPFSKYLIRIIFLLKSRYMLQHILRRTHFAKYCSLHMGLQPFSSKFIWRAIPLYHDFPQQINIFMHHNRYRKLSIGFCHRNKAKTRNSEYIVTACLVYAENSLFIANCTLHKRWIFGR